MQVTFIGVGAAFDEREDNCCIHLMTQGDHGPVSVLLDCGFTAATAFWRLGPQPNDLDALWISHFHGDHFFGVPALLLRFWEGQRTKPLTIIGRAGIQETIETAMDMAYPGFRAKMLFPLTFIEAEPGRDTVFSGLTFTCADNDHGQPCLAVRIADARASVFYSGDGRPTPETQALAAGCDLVVHEAFGMEQDTPGHGSVPGVVEFANAAGVRRLAIVHIRADVRRKQVDEILAALAKSHCQAMMPEAGDSVELP